jgi:hypothetical protein
MEIKLCGPQAFVAQKRANREHRNFFPVSQEARYIVPDRMEAKRSHSSPAANSPHELRTVIIAVSRPGVREDPLEMFPFLPEDQKLILQVPVHWYEIKISGTILSFFDPEPDGHFGEIKVIPLHRKTSLILARI